MDPIEGTGGGGAADTGLDTEEQLIEQFNEFLTEVMMQDVILEFINEN